ncbi:MAG: hypothetical protein WC856_25360 [Methylococcaceae bacterium]|jgi:hypothetical protein
MTTKVSADQARDLARSFREVSVQLGDYRFKNWNFLTPKQRQELEDSEWTLLNYSSDLITLAVGITLDDAKASLDRIQEATTQAKEAIETIKNIKKAIIIAGAVIKLGAAIVTKNPEMIGSAVEDIFSALTSDKDTQ